MTSLSRTELHLQIISTSKSSQELLIYSKLYEETYGDKTDSIGFRWELLTNWQQKYLFTPLKFCRNQFKLVAALESDCGCNLTKSASLQQEEFVTFEGFFCSSWFIGFWESVLTTKWMKETHAVYQLKLCYSKRSCQLKFKGLARYPNELSFSSGREAVCVAHWYQ